MMPNPKDRLDIRNYFQDGFEHVCDIKHYPTLDWFYDNISPKIRYSHHTSWVYAITVDYKIYKIGESGNRLYIPGDDNLQPRKNSDNRLGRYRGGDSTDKNCRQSLKPYTSNPVHRVSFYAKTCPIEQIDTQVQGMTICVSSTSHKGLEKVYLDYIYKGQGKYPELNKGRA